MCYLDWLVLWDCMIALHKYDLGLLRDWVDIDRDIIIFLSIVDKMGEILLVMRVKIMWGQGRENMIRMTSRFFLGRIFIIRILVLWCFSVFYSNGSYSLWCNYVTVFYCPYIRFILTLISFFRLWFLNWLNH